MSVPVLSPDLADRILAKLGLSARPSADLQGLRGVYGAWCRNVPFDNVRKLIHLRRGDPGPLPGDHAVDFFDAWLTHGTGGTCWAGNGALHALLVSLDFDACRGVGTMLSSPDLPPNHGMVLVTCGGARYVTDASILHGEPLPLDEHASTSVGHPAWGVHCGKREGHWYIRWRPMHRPEGFDCRLERIDVTRDVFVESHERTRVASPFNDELYIRVLRGNSIVGAAHGGRIEFTSAAPPVERPLQADERVRFLVEEIGLSEEIVRELPADVPVPVPASASAQDAPSSVAADGPSRP